VLITDRKDQLIRTIVSRSIDLSFDPLSESELDEILNVYSNRDDYETALRLSRGSVERGEYFLDDDGFKTRNKAAGFLMGIAKGIPVFKTMSFLDDLSEDSWIFLEYLYSVVRDVLYIHNDLDDEILNKDRKSFLEDIAAEIDYDSLMNAREYLDDMLNREDFPIQEDHTFKSTIIKFREKINE
jgi:hypothetical protein